MLVALRSQWWLLAVAALSFLILSIPPADAAPVTYIVTVAENSIDMPDGACDADCTLTDAINAANANPGHDTILFDPVVFAPGDGDTITPTLAPLPLVDAREGITIDGTGREVQIVGYELAVEADGLVFFSPPGQQVIDVMVRNIAVSYFRTQILVCPGKSGDACGYDASNVTIEDSALTDSYGPSLVVSGRNLSNITIDRTTSVGPENFLNGAGPTRIIASNMLSDIVVRDSLGRRANQESLTLGGAVAEGVLIEGNTTRRIVFDLHEASDVSVVTNDASSGGLSWMSGVNIDDVLVSGNTFLSSQPGLALSIVASGAVGRVQVIGNSISGLPGPDDTAMTLQFANSTETSVVRENSITGSDSGGLTIAGNGARVTISRNSIFNNSGIGIDLFGSLFVNLNDPGDADTGPNGLLNFPVIGGFVGSSVTGTACVGCLVELFLSDNDPRGYGEGQTFLRDATADAEGQFAVLVCGLTLAAGAKLTSTATDPQGNTSEFSLNYTLPGAPAPCPATPTPSPTQSPHPTPTAAPVVTPTPATTPTTSAPATLTATPTTTPTPTSTGGAQGIWGDSDCDGETTSRDNQALLRRVLSQNALSQTEPCPDLGEAITVGGTQRIWGDWDCDGEISSRDNQALLRRVLSQNPLSQTEPCPDIGEDL